MASYDERTETLEQVAVRYRVSFEVVKKLLGLRRLWDIAGPKSMFTATRRHAIRQLVGQRPDITLAEFREALGLQCALSTTTGARVADFGERARRSTRVLKRPVVRGWWIVQNPLQPQDG